MTWTSTAAAGLREEVLTPHEMPMTARGPMRRSPDHSKETILVVDDNDADRRFLSIVLTDEGYRVLPASNGESALKLFKARMDEVDLVLADMLMPGMDGIQFVRCIKELRGSQKVIITSGYMYESAVDAGLPATTFVEKSPDTRTLLREIRANLDKHTPDTRKLVQNIRAAFRHVGGPPRITLSVARGMDEGKPGKLDALARKQDHHAHWKHVTPQEMKRFGDVWVFMDCEALRFYLPAFMISYLEHAGELVELSEEPAWMTTGFYNPSSERVACFTPEQRECVLQFLQTVARTKRNPTDLQMFEEYILRPWGAILAPDRE